VEALTWINCDVLRQPEAGGAMTTLSEPREGRDRIETVGRRTCCNRYPGQSARRLARRDGYSGAMDIACETAK
jgi:hypothetical protein